MKKKKINSLKELKIRKKELRMEMELTKREFSHSIGTSRANVKDFLVQNVALPVGAAGLGIAGIRKLFGSSDEEKIPDGQTIIQRDSSSIVMKTILPLLISAVQTYFFKKTAEHTEPTATNVYRAPAESHYVHNGQSAEY